MTYKSIFTAGVARYLLKLGNPIYDIKPDKKNKDKTCISMEPVFVYGEFQEFPYPSCKDDKRNKGTDTL